MRTLSRLLYCISICMLFACFQHVWIGQVGSDTWQMVRVSAVLMVVAVLLGEISQRVSR